jgi:hypothetical protein
MPQTSTFKPVTDKQRQVIVDLTAKAGRQIAPDWPTAGADDIVIPRTSRAAAKLIPTLGIMAREANGGHDHPTPSQLELLADLADEADREPYKTPKTRAQASALIKRVLDARAAAEAKAQAEQEAVAA